MSAARLVTLAAASGELATLQDVDSVLRELHKSVHRDVTWKELVDALLEQRFILTEARRKAPAPMA